MSKKQEKPTEPAVELVSLPTTGGSYLADAAGGIQRLAGPTETPPPRRRGFGEPAPEPAAPDQPKEPSCPA